MPEPAEPVELMVSDVEPVAPADKPIVVPVALVKDVEVAETELTRPDDTKLRRLPFTVIPPVPVFVRSIPPLAPVERLSDPSAEVVPLYRLIVEATGVVPYATLRTPDVLSVSTANPPFNEVAPRTRPPAPLLLIVKAPLFPAPRVILARAPVVPELKFKIEVVGTVPYPTLMYPEVVKLPDVSYCAMVLAVPVVLELTERATGAEKLNVVPDGFKPDPMLSPFADEIPRLARAVGKSAQSSKFSPLCRKVL